VVTYVWMHRIFSTGCIRQILTQTIDTPGSSTLLYALVSDETLFWTEIIDESSQG